MKCLENSVNRSGRGLEYLVGQVTSWFPGVIIIRSALGRVPLEIFFPSHLRKSANPCGSPWIEFAKPRPSCPNPPGTRGSEQNAGLKQAVGRFVCASFRRNAGIQLLSVVDRARD